MLEALENFSDLPYRNGAAKLEAVALCKATLVAPFKGRMMAVSDVLKAEIDMILPAAGHCGESDRARAYWRAPGQWLVFGALDAAKLAGMAATADMSDALTRLRLLAPPEVLARLVEIDVQTLQTGQVAHTVLADIPATIIAIEGGVELLIPRSYARSATARIKMAMQSALACGALT